MTIRRLPLLVKLLTICGAAAAGPSTLPQTVDRIFAMTKIQWEAYVPRLAQPKWWAAHTAHGAKSKWQVRLRQTGTGTGVVASDLASGTGISIQPFYSDDRDPPTKLVVGSFQTLGKLPANAAASVRKVQRGAQRLVGARYSVSARYVRKPPSWEGFEFTVMRAGSVSK